LWKATTDRLKTIGLTETEIKTFINYKLKHDHQYQMHQISSAIKDKVRIIRITDQQYPQQLKETVGALVEPPLLLFHKGALLNFDNLVAIVGTRESSSRGRSIARRLAKELAEKGYVIASGLARGIDTQAHEGALEAYNGKTISVLAWMKPVYPRENVELLEDIQQRGAVMSENYLRPRQKYSPAEFVLRNRIISGISRVLIAVETDEKGGTVHQVNLALSQGRTVFTVTPDDNPRARRGYDTLMEKGALPLREVDDVLHFLQYNKPKISRISLDSFEKI
ncbi:MAG: DNA-processing protein DprA, partial [Nitrososphaerales archaeon]